MRRFEIRSVIGPAPRKAYKRLGVLVACVVGLSIQIACSPGGVVAGTIGVAGAVAGTAVDVVLRENIQQGEIE